LFASGVKKSEDGPGSNARNPLSGQQLEARPVVEVKSSDSEDEKEDEEFFRANPMFRAWGGKPTSGGGVQETKRDESRAEDGEEFSIEMVVAPTTQVQVESAHGDEEHGEDDETLLNAATGIGGDWVVSTDPDSGKPHYSNMATMETSLEWPKEVPPPDSGRGHASDEAEGGKEWIALFDDESGEYYYHNRQTDQTTWTKPGGYSAPRVQEIGLKEGWEASSDFEGDMYYHHVESGETSYDHPGFESWEGEEAGGQAEQAEEGGKREEKSGGDSVSEKRKGVEKGS
jgi:hypothetical protein